MKTLKKIIWYWKCFFGRRYFITLVEDGLKEDEILINGHRIYISKKGIEKWKS